MPEGANKIIEKPKDKIGEKPIQETNAIGGTTEESESIQLSNGEWTERMMRIHNQEIALSYPEPSKSKMLSAQEYKFNIDKIELEDGITVEPGQPGSVLETDMAANEEGTQTAKTVYFLSPTGKMTFDLSKVKGMEGMKGITDAENPTVNMGMLQIVSTYHTDSKRADKVEISAYLSDPLLLKKELEDGSEARVELVQGEYQKPAEGDGILKFSDGYVNNKDGKTNVTKITEIKFHEEEKGEEKEDRDKTGYFYKAFASTAFHLQNARDEEGLVRADSAEVTFFDFPMELRDVSIDDSEGKMHAETGTILWRNTRLELSQIEAVGKKTKTGTESETGKALHIDTVTARIDGFNTVMQFHYDKEKGASAGSATVTTKLNFGKKKDGKEEVKDLFDFVLALNDDKETSAEDIKTSTRSTAYIATKNIKKVERKQKETTKREKTLASVVKRLKENRKKRAKTTGEETTAEKTSGKETPAEKTTGEETTAEKTSGKETPAEKTIGEETTAAKTSGKEIPAENHQKKSRKEKASRKVIKESTPAKIIEEDIYTRDGFAKIENAAFAFEKEESEAGIKGEGDVKIQDIPAIIYVKDKPKKVTAFEPEDAVEGVAFTIDSSGNLNAEFEDDEEVELNLKRIGKKENSGEGTKYSITIGKLAIENGYFKIGSVEMERGLSLEQEGFEKSEDSEDPMGMSEEVKTFFDCTLEGSVINEGEEESIKLTPEGMEVHVGKTKLGKFAVNDFMGFLSGEVNFHSGEIGVSAEKAYEPDKLQESFFNIAAGTPSVEASIPTGIPGLSAELDISPSVGIGGSVGIAADRGKPLFEEWENGDQLELEGEIGAEGEAGITIGAGVKFGTDFLASIDLKLEGGLKITIEGSLSGNTALEYQKVSKKEAKESGKKKLQQAEDFTFEGSLEGKFSGALNLNSTAKFLFWKKQLFNIELWKKDLAKLKIKGEGKKDKDKKGILEGWELNGGEFSAKWFSKEVAKQYTFGKEGDQGTQDGDLGPNYEELVKNCGDEAKNAWAVLCKLQAQRKDTAIVLSKEDKAALDSRIEAAKEEVAAKITEYLAVLEADLVQLQAKYEQADSALEDAKKNVEKCSKKYGLSMDVYEQAQWGGFQKENYEQIAIPEEIKKEDYPDFDSKDKAKKKEAKARYEQAVKSQKDLVAERTWHNDNAESMAAIDLMIAYMLGQVSNQKLQQIAEEFGKDDGSKLMEEEKKAPGLAASIYKDGTRFMDAVSEYQDQNSYYDILMEKAIYTRRKKGSREVDGKIYEFERTSDVFPEPLKKIIDSKPDIRMKEVLKYVLANRGPNDEFLYITPKQKLDLLKEVFGFTPTKANKQLTRKSWVMEQGREVKKGLFKAVGGLFADIFSQTEENEDSDKKENISEDFSMAKNFKKTKRKVKTLEDVVKGKNVINIFDEMKQLKDNVGIAQEKADEAQKKKEEAKNSIAWVRLEMEEYKTKLESVQTKASIAVADRAFDPKAAKEAINIYSENYIQSMKGNHLKEALDKVAEDNKNKPLPKSVSKH